MRSAMTWALVLACAVAAVVVCAGLLAYSVGVGVVDAAKRVRSYFG